MTSLIRVLMAVACAAVSALAQAQEYPAKTVRIVVPYSAGGGLDTLARGMAQRLFEAWGKQVLVENKPGANTIIGTEHVAKSEPDGYTLLLTEPALVINSSLYDRLPYDPFRDFAPITQLVTVNQVLVVNPSLPAKNIEELIGLARSKPGGLSYASFGAGSSGHLNLEMFQRMAGVKLNHIPYKGGAPALTDIAAGHVHMMFGAFGLFLAQWKSGNVRILAVGSARRLVQYPDIPTVAEAGLPGFEATSWLGLFAPAATPQEVVNKIYVKVKEIFADRAFREKSLDPQGFEPVTSSPRQFSGYVKSDALKWGKVAREAKVKLD